MFCMILCRLNNITVTERGFQKFRSWISFLHVFIAFKGKSYLFLLYIPNIPYPLVLQHAFSVIMDIYREQRFLLMNEQNRHEAVMGTIIHQTKSLLRALCYTLIPDAHHCLLMSAPVHKLLMNVPFVALSIIVFAL